MGWWEDNQDLNGGQNWGNYNPGQGGNPGASTNANPGYGGGNPDATTNFAQFEGGQVPADYADAGGGYQPTDQSSPYAESYTGPSAQTNAFDPRQQVGHDGTINGMTREQYRDAWQGSGAKSMADLEAFIGQHGGTVQSGNGTVMTPFGESIDMLQGARTNGQGSAAWGGTGGGAPQQGNLGDLSRPSGGVQGFGGGYSGPAQSTQSAGGVAGGWDGEKYTASKLTAPTAYQPQSTQGPAPLSLAQLQQPGAVRADQVGPGQQVRADQVRGPEALTARNVNDPTGFQNLSADQLQTDPSYQFRLKQGLGAMQASAAAKGTLFGGATLKGLQDYAGQSASQEYQAANERARQTYQQNLGNQQSVTGQNNAAQAQAYGLTNQYQQQAQLANQSANMQAGQFNSSQAQQAAMANQQANLNAGQFNAGMNFNTQQGNIQNALNAYNAYQPLNQQNQQFNASRQDQANQQNFNNQFNVEQGNNANAQNAWQGNVNAQLGQGNLNLGYTQASNQYNLGQGQLALGNRQADQSYALGQGQLGLGWAGHNLASQGQQFNQGLSTFNTNYGVFRDNRDTAFNQQYALAGLGQNAAAGYGNQVGNAYTNQGNANAAAGIAGANAWTGALGNISNAAQKYGYWAGQGGGGGGGGGQYDGYGNYLGE